MTCGKTAAISSFSVSRGNVADFGVRRQSGFTLLELLLLLAVIAIMVGFAVMGLGQTLSGLRSNRAMYQVIGSLREARMLAISQNIRVYMQFSADGIKAEWDPITGSAAKVQESLINPSAQLESGYRFIASGAGLTAESDEPYKPNDPDFSNITSVITPATDRYIFTPDGFLVRESAPDITINGTIFIAPPANVNDDNNRLVRAVTILGATGRISGWQLKDNAKWRIAK